MSFDIFVVTFWVTDLLPKLIDMLLFSTEKLNFFFQFPYFFGIAGSARHSVCFLHSGFWLEHTWTTFRKIAAHSDPESPSSHPCLAAPGLDVQMRRNAQMIQMPVHSFTICCTSLYVPVQMKHCCGIHQMQTLPLFHKPTVNVFSESPCIKTLDDKNKSPTHFQSPQYKKTCIILRNRHTSLESPDKKTDGKGVWSLFGET